MRKVKIKIKKDDIVKVMAGASKGKEGKIIKVFSTKPPVLASSGIQYPAFMPCKCPEGEDKRPTILPNG